MLKNLKKFEKELPKLTGVYIFKNKNGDIMYIGKAKNLQSRVNSYFQKYSIDWKIKQLIDEYDDIEHIVTRTETESLLLEAQLIQKYKPPFNVLLKEGQPFLYILFKQLNPSISSYFAKALSDEIRHSFLATADKSERGIEKKSITNDIKIPIVKLVRNKKEKGIYIGPFLQKTPARKTYNFIMKTFQLNICNKKLEHGCLDYHIGNCAGSCKPNFDVTDYTFRIQLAYDTLKNNQRDFIQKIKQQMAIYTVQFEFEKAQQLNHYLHNVDFIFATINTHFNENKFATDIFVASTPTPYIHNVQSIIHKDLQEFLKTKTPIRTIDCFDISHFQSSHIVGSCIRFTDGKPEKSMFRRFKIKTLQTQNDYAALQEIIQRRYKSKDEYPDLIVIDGGKGQLSSAQHILPEVLIVSLAKREETLYGNQFPEGIQLDIKTPVGRLIIALRDYAHHFAISYHRLKKKKEWKN